MAMSNLFRTAVEPLAPRRNRPMPRASCLCVVRPTRRSESMSRSSIIATALLWTAQALLAAFFGFVGFMKSFAPMAELATHHAWVAGLPPLLARSVGVSEMACALLLVIPGTARRPARWIPASAIALLLNQLVAVAVHAQRGELAHSVGQNVLLILLLAFVAFGRGGERRLRVAA